MPKTYTVKQVAEALGFSTNTVYKYLDEGKIQATRLGTEGRFRIPEVEVTRLLGEMGRLPAAAPQPPAEPLPVSATPSSPRPQGVGGPNPDPEGITLGLLNRVANPDLFDWFLALSGISVGLTEFLYPAYYQSVAVEPFRTPLLVAKIFLLVAGLGLLASDIFIPLKKVSHHLLSRLPFSVAFLALTSINFLVGNFQTASYLAALSAFSLLSIVWHKNIAIRFLSFTYLLLLLLTVSFVNQPEALVYFDLRYFISNNPSLFLILASALSTIWFASAIYSHYKSPSLLALFTGASGLTFFLLGVSFLTDQAWTRAVISFCVSSFSFILPSSVSLESLTRYTRRQMLIAFSWLSGIILLGTFMAFYVRESNRSAIFTSQKETEATAASTLSDFIQDASSAIVTIGRSITPDSRAQDLKNLYLSTNIFRRLAIVSTEGIITAAYPPYVSTPSRSMTSDSFISQAVSAAGPLVSHVFPPITPDVAPAVYITSPVTDGLLLGIVDIAKLASRLSGSTPNGTGSRLIIADPQGRIILPVDPDSAATPLPPESPILLAAHGQSGQVLGYSQSGHLSFQTYSPIPGTNWGLLHELSYAAAFKTASLVSFTAFLVTLASGVAGLAGAIYFSLKKS